MRINRRSFLKHAGLAVVASSVRWGQYAAAAVEPPPTTEAHLLFLEAEQFATHGGWDVDQQSTEQVGSSYLLAHGLGVPVEDAVTVARVTRPGTFRVWVRTRDWVAPWKAPGAPGKFELHIDGRPLPVIFGTEGEEWHWQDGGTVELGPKPKIALHDLTGFEGRCDAIVFSSDLNFIPPNEPTALAQFRRVAQGLPHEPNDGGRFDLVVIGGGLAGSCAALSAARQGLSVALIQDRPVLGGNASSEVRVWPAGATKQPPYPHVGEIVEELCPIVIKGVGGGNAKRGSAYDDAKKSRILSGEPRITVLMDHRAYAVETRDGAITAVLSQHTRTAGRLRISGRFFADCTGDATVGFLAKADYEMSREQHQGMSNLWNVIDVADPNQVLHCECKDKTALSMRADKQDTVSPFPRCPWAIDLTDKPFPGRKKFKGQWGGKDPLSNLGGWFWESGFNRDPITDVERIRDLNLRAMYGAWDALKNVDKLYPNHRLGWAAFIAGKRESRRLMGDLVLTVDDFKMSRSFPDGAFPCSWHIDVHSADTKFDDGHGEDAFISGATQGKDYKYVGPYWAPYRCLYSRNVPNLFMAGRDISVTHEALGPVRVMRTCGMMGEVVGKAAAICIEQQTTPRGVYEKHLALLQQKMNQPGNYRRS